MRNHHKSLQSLGRVGISNWALSLVGIALATLTSLPLAHGADALQSDILQVGFARRDITPQSLDSKPAWIAGYGHNRRATGVHDPLYCRAVVLSDGAKTVALATVDLIGLQYPVVQRIRAALPDLDYVLVASTHNHEGPDVIGIWGPTPLKSGVDSSYLDFVVQRTTECIREAVGKPQSVSARFGMTDAKDLLKDARLPEVYDDMLRVLMLEEADATKSSENAPCAGLLVHWGCHPEALGSENTLLTADFHCAMIAALEKRYGCPVVVFTGAIGGLMTNPSAIQVNGQEMADETFEFAEAYGQQVAERTQRAVESAKPIVLTPLAVAAQSVNVPVANPLYIAAKGLGVFNRELAASSDGDPQDKRLSVRTEVACLRFGKLHIAAIPGEIYPELVSGKFQEPVEPGADYPNAPLEPHVDSLLSGKSWMLFGLANDEIGYIIPKRQWDVVPPFAYGRGDSQYGESNSCGSEAAPIIMLTFQRCVEHLDSMQ